MKILDLGCGKEKIHGAIGIDMNEYKEVDIVHDLNKKPYPINDKFDLINASHIIEHLKNPSVLLSECVRLVKDDETIRITVPSERWGRIYYEGLPLKGQVHHWCFRCYGRRPSRFRWMRPFRKILWTLFPTEYVIEIKKSGGKK
jgi:SAM-dependent methyltransferase